MVENLQQLSAKYPIDSDKEKPDFVDKLKILLTWENPWIKMMDHLRTTLHQSKSIDMKILENGFNYFENYKFKDIVKTGAESSSTNSYFYDLWEILSNLTEVNIAYMFLFLKTNIYLCYTKLTEGRGEYQGALVGFLESNLDNVTLFQSVTQSYNCKLFEDIHIIQHKLDPFISLFFTFFAMIRKALITQNISSSRIIWDTFCSSQSFNLPFPTFMKSMNQLKPYMNALGMSDDDLLPLLVKLVLSKQELPSLLEYVLANSKTFLSPKNIFTIAERVIAPHVDESNLQVAMLKLDQFTNTINDLNNDIFPKMVTPIMTKIFSDSNALEELQTALLSMDPKNRQKIMTIYQKLFNQKVHDVDLNQFKLACKFLQRNDTQLILEFIMSHKCSVMDMNNLIEEFLVVEEVFASIDLLRQIIGTSFQKYKNAKKSFFLFPFDCPKLAIRFNLLEKDIEVELEQFLYEKFKENNDLLQQLFSSITKIPIITELSKLYIIILERYLLAYINLKFTRNKSDYQKVEIVTNEISFIPVDFIASPIIYTFYLKCISESIKAIRCRPLFFKKSEKGLNIFLKMREYCNTKVGITDYSNFVEEFNNSIVSIFHELVEDIHDAELTQDDLHHLSQKDNMSNVIELLEKIELVGTDLPLKIREHSNKLSELNQEYAKLKRILQWFRENNYGGLIESRGVDLSEYKPSSITINSFEMLIEQIKECMGDITELSRDSLYFFIEEQSLLFQFILSVKLQGKAQDLLSLNRGIEETVNFITKLLNDDQITLRSLEEVDIDKVIRSIRQFKSTLERELLIIKKRFGNDNNKELVFNFERFAAAVKLKELVSQLSSLTNTLKDYNMECVRSNDVGKIEEKFQTIKQKNDIRLSEAKEMLDEFEKMLFELQSYHMKYFELLCQADCKSLVQFLRNQTDFKRQIQILKDRARKDKYQEDVLNALVVSRAYLEPYLSNKTSFQEIAMAMKKYFSKEEDINIKLESIRTCASSLSHIKLWFSRSSSISLEDIYQTISLFENYGKWYSVLSKNNEGPLLSLRYTLDGVEQQLEDDELTDLVRISIFRMTDQSANDEDTQLSKKCLEGFISSYKYATKSHSYRLALEASGHPRYQGAIEYLEDKLDWKLLKEKSMNLRKELKYWNDSVQNKCKEVKQLLRLSRSQFIYLISLLKEQMVNIDNQETVFAQFAPYLYTCFPECGLNGNDDLTPEIVFNCLKLAVENLNLANSRTPDLECAVNFVEMVKERINIPEEEEEEESQSTMILKASGIASVDLLCILLDRLDILSNNCKSGRLLQPGQVIFCSSSTTKEDIKWFDKRRKAFPTITYALVGVDQLQSSVRETLIKLEGKKQFSGKTYLIFYSSTGVDAFSFLPIEDISQRIEVNHYRKWILNYQKSYSSLQDMITISGRAASGKTKFIKDRMEGGARLRISVTEDFSSEKVLNRLKEIPKNSNGCRLVLHFDISGLEEQQLRQLEYFLFNYFFCGLIIDEQSGLIQIMEKKYKLTMYFEIPDCAILTKVPTLMLLNPHPHILDEKNTNFDCTSDTVRTVFTYIDLYINNRLDSVSLTNITMLESIACEKLVHNFFKNNPRISDTMIHKMLFIRLMYDRCLYLKKREEFINSLEPEEFLHNRVKNFNTRLFKLFLEECTYLSNKDVKQDWSKLPVAFTARLISHIPQYAILCMDKEYLPEMEKLNIIYRKDGIAHIRVALAYSFGLEETNRLLPILERNKYTLTIDFAIKLLLLNERRNAGLPVILQGETGLGKSELLRLYAEIQNHRSKLIPDIAFKMNKWFLKHLSNQGKLDEYHKWYENYCKQNGYEIDEDVKESVKKFQPNILRQFLKGQEHEDMDHYYLELGKSFADKARRIYDEYHLLTKTAFVDKVLKSFEESNDFSLRTVDALMTFLEDVVSSKVRNVFHKITMHNGWTCKKLRDKMQQIIKETNKCQKYDGCQDFSTVVFVDELNTSVCMGVLKEMFIDNTLDGEELPNNIFLVGAINPASESNDNDEPEYCVRNMPDSMKLLVLDFDKLNPDQERDFLSQMFETEAKKRMYFVEWKRAELMESIAISQKFVAEARLKRVRVSIRDMLRAANMYWFFNEQNPLQFEFNEHIKSLYMAIALAYYFRLPVDLRNKFYEHFKNKSKRFLSTELDFVDVVHDNLISFYDKVHKLGSIPQGIAGTQAFLENLFCCIICIQANQPLIITGPPGTSKTLSYNIATSTKNELFPTMKTVHRAHYQCNELSTAREISNVFKAQIKMKKSFEKAEIFSAVCSVFLDEAGLPIEKKESLKVIHYYLDHPEVSSVIISNTQLDAAKTNRAFQLLQSDTRLDDLRALSLGCLLLNNMTRNNSLIIDALCHSFLRVNQVINSDRKDGLFHLRDFVYFLRMLKRNQTSYPDILHTDNIYHALQRNFNGVTKNDFQKIVELFFSNIKGRGVSMVIPAYKNNYLEIIKESINDRLLSHENPNSAPFRYVLIVDPSNTASAVDLLFSEGFIKQQSTQVVCVSDFPDDSNEISQSSVISKVKLAMETGQTIVLINSGRINASFYDVFNRHFQIVISENKEVNHFANVAVGALSKPCIVHPNFQIIIHMPLSQYASCSIPFLNRFEKYILGYEQVLEERMNHMKLSKGSEIKIYRLYTKLKEGVEDFVNVFSSSSFYGYLKGETINSLLHKILVNSDVHSTTPNIPLPFRINNSIDENEVLRLEDKSCEDEIALNPLQRLPEFVRRLNFFLLQIARPESIYMARSITPKAYLEEYLTKQEHFSARHLISNMIDQHFSNNQSIRPSKNIVFTRSSGNIYQLFNSSDNSRYLLADSLRQNGKLPDENSFHTDHILQLFSLSQISSQSKLDEKIDRFINSDSHYILLITADMRIVTKNQINYLRYIIDEKFSISDFENKKNCPLYNFNKYPIVCCIIHFPPEWIQLTSTYDVIFYDWRFAYVDSFDFENKDLIEKQQMNIKQYDPRFWLSIAIGYIQTDYLNQVNFKHDFELLYQKAVNIVVQENFIPIGQKSNIAKLILGNDNIRHVVMTEFGSMWTNRNLAAIVQNASMAITEGRSSEGLLDLIYSALEHSMLEKVRLYINVIIYFGNSLKKLVDNKQDYDSKLVEKILLCIPKCTKNKSITISDEHLPFSTIIIRRLMELVKDGSIIQNDFLVIQITDIKLLDAISLIEKNRKYLEAFKYDLFTAVFKINRRDVGLYDFIDCILMNPNFNDELDYSKIENILAIQTKLFNTILLQNYLFRKLPHNLRKRNQIESAIGNCKNISEISMIFYCNSIDYMYQKLKSLVNEVLEEEKLRGWIENFEKIDSDYISEKMGLDVEAKYQLCYIYFEFFKEFKYNAVVDCTCLKKQVFDIFEKSYNALECISIMLEEFSKYPSENVSNWITNISVMLFSRNYLDENRVRCCLAIINTSDKKNIWSYLPMMTRAQLFLSLCEERKIYSFDIEELIEEELSKDNSDKDVIFIEELQMGQPREKGILENLVLRCFIAILGKTEFVDIFDEYEILQKQSPTFYKQLLAHAYQIAILHQVANKLCKNSIVEKLSSFSEKELGIIKDILDSRKNMKLYLLSNVKPHQQLINLLTPENERFLKSVGLDEWIISSDTSQDECKTHYFPFMYNNSPMGKRYRDLVNLFRKAVNGNVADIVDRIQQIQIEEEIYEMRMFLLVLCYNEYFLKGKDCPILISLINQHDILEKLRINKEECHAYHFFAKGPYDEVNEQKQHLDRYTRYHFSKQHLASNDLKDSTHLLANVAAVCLGVPKDKNHMYNRAFNPEVLHSSFGCGSTYNNTNWDCGYQSDGVTILHYSQYNRKIMGGSELHHAALNVLTWSAFTLCMLFNPKENCKSATEHHMLNYIDDDGFMGLSMTKQEKVIKYIFSRVSTFLALVVHNHTFSSRNIDPVIFFTHTLMNFYLNAPHSNVAKGYWETNGDLAPQIRDYEDFIKNICMQPVIDKYEEIEKEQRKGSEESRKLTELLNFQKNEQDLRNKNDYYPHFTAAIDALVNFKDEDIPFVVHYRIHSKRLEALKHVPKLINFYTFLHKYLNKKYSEEELAISVLEAVKNISRDNEEQNKRIWKNFQEAWKECKGLIEELRVCHDAQQAGEDKIIDMDDNTPLYSLLKVGNNEIIRFIESGITNSWYTIEGYYEKLDAFCLAYDMEESFLSSLLPNIKKDMLEYFVKATCDIDEKVGYHFRWDRVNHLLREKLVFGKPYLDLEQLKNIEFQFKEENIVVEEDDNTDITNDSIYPMSIHMLYDNISYFRKENIFEDLEERKKSRLGNCFSMQNSDSLIALIEGLNKILLQLKHDIDEKKEDWIHLMDTQINKYIESKKIEVSQKSRQALKILGYPLKNILSIASVSLDKYLSNDSLFADYKELNIQLDKESEKHLEAFCTKILNNMKKVENINIELLEKQIEFVRYVANILLKDEKRKMVDCEPEKSLIDVFKGEFLSLNQQLLKEMLPVTIRAKNFAPFMRKIQQLSGKYELLKPKIISGNNSQYIYKEKVANLEDIQFVELKGCEPIAIELVHIGNDKDQEVPAIGINEEACQFDVNELQRTIELLAHQQVINNSYNPTLQQLNNRVQLLNQQLDLEMNELSLINEQLDARQSFLEQTTNQLGQFCQMMDLCFEIFNSL